LGLLSNGETSIAEAYDPKSLEHILAAPIPLKRYGGGDGGFYEVLQNIMSLFLDLN
jgi:hypothetical protein